MQQTPIQELIDKINESKCKAIEIRDRNSPDSKPHCAAYSAILAYENVLQWLDESSPSDNTQIRDGWVRVQDGLPPLVEGQDYSENVIAWLDGERKIMNYAILPDDYNNLCYAWCMVYNGLDGDAEFDDNYYPSHWQPLPTPPND